MIFIVVNIQSDISVTNLVLLKVQEIQVLFLWPFTIPNTKLFYCSKNYLYQNNLLDCKLVHSQNVGTACIIIFSSYFCHQIVFVISKRARRQNFTFKALWTSYNTILPRNFLSVHSKIKRKILLPQETKALF